MLFCLIKGIKETDAMNNEEDIVEMMNEFYDMSGINRHYINGQVKYAFGIDNVVPKDEDISEEPRDNAGVPLSYSGYCKFMRACGHSIEDNEE